MTKLKTLLGLAVLAIVIACEGPEGPQGPPGFDGEDGVNILGQVVEVENISFDYLDGNLWTSNPISFEEVGITEVFESDAVLVYRYDGEVELSDGSTASAWSQIPQNFFTAEGTLQYVFAHTFVDFEIFIDGNYDLSNIDIDFTDNQLFRIVVVPAEFAQSADFNATDFNAVMSNLKLNVDNIEKISLD